MARQLRYRRALGALALGTLLPTCSLEAGGAGKRLIGTSREPSQADAASSPADAARALPFDGGGVDANAAKDGATDAEKPELDAMPELDAQLDATPKLDAELDAGAETGPSLDGGEPDAPSEVDAATDAGCLEGRPFAFRVDLAVQWVGTLLAHIVPVLEPGRGVVSLYVAATFGRAGASGAKHVDLRYCGVEIPEFLASTGEVYGADLPPAAWEQPTMPGSRWAVELACDQPGCTLFSEPISVLLGSPFGMSQQFWQLGPYEPFELNAARDDDNDQYPGVTLNMRGPERTSASGRPYSYPPVTVFRDIRAAQIMLAMGLRGSLSGVVDSCSTMHGSVDQAEVRTRAVGLRAYRMGDPSVEIAVSPAFVRFLDENFPQWQVSLASFEGRRIESSQCDAVRAAFAGGVGSGALR